MSIGDIFGQHVKNKPNEVCFIYEDKEWTFAQVNINNKWNNDVINIANICNEYTTNANYSKFMYSNLESRYEKKSKKVLFSG